MLGGEGLAVDHTHVNSSVRCGECKPLHSLTVGKWVAVLQQVQWNYPVIPQFHPQVSTPKSRQWRL